MHVEFLVEEASAEAALDILLPRILGDGHTWQVRVYQGKPDLRRKLVNRLRGYAHWIAGADVRIVVLIDRDSDDCIALKAELEQAAASANLATRSAPQSDGTFIVLNRIAIEELEAWFFGDWDAVRTAYPKVPSNVPNRQAFRQSDAIAGGTCERLAQLLKQAGYHRSGYPKVAGAKAIAEHMEVQQNRSPSFKAFKTGLEELCGVAPTAR